MIAVRVLYRHAGCQGIIYTSVIRNRNSHPGWVSVLGKAAFLYLAYTNNRIIVLYLVFYYFKILSTGKWLVIVKLLPHIVTTAPTFLFLRLYKIVFLLLNLIICVCVIHVTT